MSPPYGRWQAGGGTRRNSHHHPRPSARDFQFTTDLNLAASEERRKTGRFRFIKIQCGESKNWGVGASATREMRVRFEIGSVVKRRGKMEMEKCVMSDSSDK